MPAIKPHPFALRLSKRLAAFAFALLFTTAVLGAGKLTVAVTHSLDLARPAEVIAIPWAEIAKAIPGALLQHLAVKDSAGRVLAYQVTNTDPLARGSAYGELLFQHDFTAGEKSAAFTIEKLDAVAPVFPTKVFARYVPERLDDFAWENDKVGHRTYGPALAEPGAGKEMLVASGLDVWCKRVSYPIVDRWYNKGGEHYHRDEGEGMDMYQVGPTRGCGGTGVWDGRKLYVSRNYKTWKILANGPIRAVFELTYAAWDAHGIKVSEVKRVTVDAGHNLDRIESTFTFSGANDLTVAIGLNKHNSNPGQELKVDVSKNGDHAALVQWTQQKSNGSLGTAIVVADGALAGFAEDERNQLILAKAVSGRPVRYYAGAGWTNAGEFTSQDAWSSYVADCAARAKSPVSVSVAGQ